ncbi:MAG: hypothetical protein EOL87_02475 [Spartobacteria bacterium]|nr:hypothetical protein [Spartobacteria bacterium]
MNWIAIGIICISVASLIMAVGLAISRHHSMMKELHLLQSLIRKQQKYITGCQQELVEKIDRIDAQLKQHLDSGPPRRTDSAFDAPPDAPSLISDVTDRTSFFEERQANIIPADEMNLPPFIPSGEQRMEPYAPMQESADLDGFDVADDPIPPFIPREAAAQRVDQMSSLSSEPEAAPDDVASSEFVTGVRCPACGRKLPFDALRIQDEQICPYCQEHFRSSQYLSSLVKNDRDRSRK